MPAGSSTISISFQLPPPGSSNKISKISELAHPSSPWTTPEIQATTISSKSASASSFHHQAAVPNQHQLPVSATRQQHQISISFHHQTAAPISFQFPPPGSSTTSASPSKATSQPAVNSTSLPHPHHGRQVCCCLDIL